MIVCHCHALTDRDIRDAAGACGGCPDALRALCAAGGTCGGCRPQVDLIVKGAREDAQRGAAQASGVAV